ncbi:hypothetical protein EYF80_045905 [Liparis tanakae]|uniref:Uncharacterized protein n=1 Tax=Liparis tanakae TaxID=230148 RepID=A0A4Z2FT26_9TELE|nr:hypothetical protein EYF80_045905 [Liparis tanakae]
MAPAARRSPLAARRSPLAARRSLVGPSRGLGAGQTRTSHEEEGKHTAARTESPAAKHHIAGWPSLRVHGGVT